MSSMVTEERTTNLVERFCGDGRTYAIRPMSWTLATLKSAHERYIAHPILNDDLPKDLDGFMYYVAGNASLWFEVIDSNTEEQVGLIQVNDMAESLTQRRYISAQIHAVTWDSKAAYRIDLFKQFIQWLFRALKLHRLQAEIPPKFGGAIRTMIKAGFTSEGRLRSARRYNNDWYDVVVLGLLETEVTNWEIA